LNDAPIRHVVLPFCALVRHGSRPRFHPSPGCAAVGTTSNLIAFLFKHQVVANCRGMPIPRPHERCRRPLFEKQTECEDSIRRETLPPPHQDHDRTLLSLQLAHRFLLRIHARGRARPCPCMTVSESVRRIGHLHAYQSGTLPRPQVLVIALPRNQFRCTR